ncbi:MAG: TfoX/Sxy family protein [Clostridia bacterium]|nr:TfoX/Sxy family protein [Clostridia bacterium]
MASSREYMDYLLEQLAGAEVSARPMMGEYVVYCRGRVIGGVYDDRFLVKPTATARAMMPEAREELPYDGAKPMLLVDRMEDREFLKELVSRVSDEVPVRKKK